MGIFNKNKTQITPVPAVQPVPTDTALTNAEAQLEGNFQPQTQQEVQYKPQVQESAPEPVKTPEAPQPVQEEVKIQQVPIYLDQSAINNLVIENNLMLKELLRIANE